MPLSELDRKALASGLGALTRGTLEVGGAALPLLIPLLKHYSTAKAERESITEIMLQDPDTVAAVVVALKKHARKLPPSVIQGLETIVQLAKA